MMLLNAAGVLLCGCSLVVDDDRRQCLSDADCAALDPTSAGSVCVDSWCTPDPSWSCLRQPAAMSPGSDPFPVTLRLEDILTQAPISEVEARLCLDPRADCDRAASETVISDDQGLVRFAVPPPSGPYTSSGLVTLQHSDLVPALYVLSPSLDRGNGQLPLQLLRSADAMRLAEQLEAALDTSRGTVLISTFDCEHAPAPGVMLTVGGSPDATTPFYSVDGLPVSTATMTDHSGYAGILNAPPGPLVVTAELESEGSLLTTMALTVKAGTITYVRMVPRGA